MLINQRFCIFCAPLRHIAFPLHLLRLHEVLLLRTSWCHQQIIYHRLLRTSLLGVIIVKADLALCVNNDTILKSDSFNLLIRFEPIWVAQTNSIYRPRNEKPIRAHSFLPGCSWLIACLDTHWFFYGIRSSSMGFYHFICFLRTFGFLDRAEFPFLLLCLRRSFFRLKRVQWRNLLIDTRDSFRC